ncbi:YybS family protein [Sporosarcina thermotolerans]|nr:hypothetical protein [Sporosarcina thermotolerans]WHT48024.1 hypothetical protein QNH10_18575 [Sporosarcina thermotolerans]
MTLKWSQSEKMMFAALMSALAAVLQSAGGFLPGVGFFISPFATAPIFMATLISFRWGSVSYLLTIFLLVLIQPSELMIFPFTTGVLGIAVGWAIRTQVNRLNAIFIGEIVLFIGICIPLFVLGFPVFGPGVSSLNLITVLMILGFSLFYSWVWIEFGLFLIRRLRRFLS